MGTRILLAVLAIITAAGRPVPSRAQGEAGSEVARAMLRGIDSVWVAVAPLNDNARSAGLDEQAIRTKVEDALRQSGLRDGRSSSTDRVLVEFVVLELPNLFAWDVDLKVFRALTVLVGSELRSWPTVTVWNWSHLGTTPRINAPTHLYEGLQVVLERLLDTYRAANRRR